jgi:hypothetical protein
LIELQIDVGLPLFADLERLAKSFTIIKRRRDLPRGHAVLCWLRDGTVKARKDRGILSA